MPNNFAPISEELAAAIQGPVGIVVSTCDARLQASVAFALGCRVWPDRKRVSVMLCPSQAATLIADIEATGRVAVNFSRPSNNRSAQLKGSDAHIEPPRALDFACVAKHTQDFIDELLPMREMSEAALRAIFHHAPDDLVVISFSPEAAFSQTPGPGAGAPI